MSKIELDLPPSVHRAVRALAKKDGISAKQLIVSAVTEKVVLHTVDYLGQRAARGSRERFLEILDRVPARPPMKGDDMPPELAKWLAGVRGTRREARCKC